MFLSELDEADPSYLKFMRANERALMRAQHETWAFAKGVSDSLHKFDPYYDISQAFLVNQIVDFSSFCTSIVAMDSSRVVLVRNLDFDFPK